MHIPMTINIYLGFLENSDNTQNCNIHGNGSDKLDKLDVDNVPMGTMVSGISHNSSIKPCSMMQLYRFCTFKNIWIPR